MNNGFGFKDECGNIHKGLDLINEGYINMLDVPLSWIKNKNHIIEREALITHKPYIDKEKIKLALNNIKYITWILKHFHAHFLVLKGKSVIHNLHFNFRFT